MRFTIGCVAAKIVLVAEVGRNRPPGLRHQRVPGHEDAGIAGARPSTQGHSQGISPYLRVVG
jgi:hypothetical protein